MIAFLIRRVADDPEVRMPRRKGRSPVENVPRNVAIGNAIDILANELGLKPTRGKEIYAKKAQKECASNLVIDALKLIGIEMAERNLKDIWTAHMEAKRRSHVSRKDAPGADVLRFHVEPISYPLYVIL